MKRLLISTALLIMLSLTVYSQGVGINEDGSDPDGSAILDVKSTTKGVLMPSMSSAQRTAISNPATGLLVYDTDTDSYWYNMGTSASPNWTELLSGNNDNDYIPTAQHPTFQDRTFSAGGTSPNAVPNAVTVQELQFALWVGYDATEKRWKYFRDAVNTRGLT